MDEQGLRRTYLDTGVFIAAWRCQDAGLRKKAEELLCDDGRVFLGCLMLELELLPSAMPFGGQKELDATKAMLSIITERTAVDHSLIERALEIGMESGCTGGDCIHIAAAELLSADEFISNEKPDSPVYKVASVRGTPLTRADLLQNAGNL